jgi:hypothetical protein
LLQPVVDDVVPESLSICGFYVVLNTTIPSTSMLARDTTVAGGRASRFGVKPLGAATDVKAGLHQGSGVTFAFEDRSASLVDGPHPIYASLIQLELSHFDPPTLIG